jgi:hypothetical protein
MKKYILLIGLGLNLLSCTSILEIEPTDRFTATTFFKTKEHAEAAVNATYASLIGYSSLSYNYIYYECATPNCYMYQNNNGFDFIANGIQDAANSAVINNSWGSCYAGIGRANTLLAKIDGIPATSLSEALKKRYIAESKFLRAFFYTQLWALYGGVPLITDAPDLAKQASLPRNSADEVLAQIIKDLDEAAVDLPTSYPVVDKGRATKGAAYAMKARALLWAGKWVEAADAAKSVIDMKAYTLFPDSRGTFLFENEGNSEVIFDIQYKFPEFAHSMDISLDAFNTVAPLADLVNDFYMANGKAITDPTSGFDPQNPYLNRDPRFYATINYPGAKYKGVVVTATTYPRTGYGQKKYTIYKDNEVPASTKNDNQSDLNYILLRYADVLLMYAEAKNEAVGPDQSVYDAINLIRKRANMPSVTAGLLKDQMRQEIRHERRIELAGEGAYYFDIRRWRTAEVVMNADIYNYLGVKFGTRKFNKDRDYLWPIPTIALQTNSALVQNPGYGK